MSNPDGQSASPKSSIAALRALGQLPPSRSLLDKELTLTLSPREDGLAAKDVPVDTLAKKVIGIRDKLRVLEQRVNSSSLTNAEKVTVEYRVTALYDALCGLMAFFSEDALGASPDVDNSAEATADSQGQST